MAPAIRGGTDMMSIDEADIAMPSMAMDTQLSRIALFGYLRVTAVSHDYDLHFDETVF
jgi:hypothetical protein